MGAKGEGHISETREPGTTIRHKSDLKKERSIEGAGRNMKRALGYE